ncbi:MAG: DUF637 domain-containing protein [Alphaproteobacteria bacterium]|nr:DUF637 domain-containing protein [Alphaproteobacteria bacterium]
MAGQLQQQTNVGWEKVDPVYQEWYHKTTGLSAPAAAVIAIAVAAATGGMGAPIVGAAEGSVSAFMANAAFSTLVTQASIALINNKGNILGALEDMGSSANLKQLAISVVSAGIAQGAVNQFGLIQDPGTSLVDKLSYNITTSTINNTVGNVINGNSLTHGLGTSLLGSLTTSAGEQATQYVGALWDLNKIDPATHLVLHGAIGCATGMGLGGQRCW